jgi:hypothetical protein
MKYILLSMFLSFQVFAHEKEIKTKADAFATGKLKNIKRHPWPFPILSIGHAMQSYQDYGGSPYWHDGLDIRSSVDQPIFASAGGKVVNLENYVVGNSLYWEVAILDDDGFVWKYHHVDRKSIPKDVIEAFRSGKRIEAGSLIGNVVRWPIVTFGEVYHHLHLLIVGEDGSYINPFLLLDLLEDTRLPSIKRIGLARNHRPLEGTTIKGPHSLFLETSDLVLHDKFTLPPHKISYRLDGADRKTVWEFSYLPSSKSDTEFINDFYLDGTCGDYRCRKFLINLNFSVTSPRQMMTLSPGEHSIEVEVEDYAGNKTSEQFRWEVL